MRGQCGFYLRGQSVVQAKKREKQNSVSEPRKNGVCLKLRKKTVQGSGSRDIGCHGKAKQEEEPKDIIIGTCWGHQDLMKAWFSGHGDGLQDDEETHQHLDASLSGLDC